MTSADEIKKLGTILSVWAHPDDETFSAAGVLATAAGNGQTVVCITATKGEAGVQNAAKWPPENLAEIREAELMEAFKVLGIKTHHWLGYEDGMCASVDKQEAVAKIGALISQYKPDTIITFGPEGMTGHPDHCCVSSWVSDASKSTDHNALLLHVAHTKEQYDQYFKQMDKKLNIFYNIDQPKLVSQSECALFYALPKDVCQQKCAALRCMSSQTEAMFKNFDETFLESAFCTEAFVKA